MDVNSMEYIMWHMIACIMCNIEANRRNVSYFSSPCLAVIQYFQIVLSPRATSLPLIWAGLIQSLLRCVILMNQKLNPAAVSLSLSCTSSVFLVVFFLSYSDSHSQTLGCMHTLTKYGWRSLTAFHNLKWGDSLFSCCYLYIDIFLS